MIIKKYDEFVTESKKVGIIYHFTGIYNLYQMFLKNNFRISSQQNYISFTRNPSMFSPELLQSKLQARIMIDGDKLSNKYKISPYKDFRNVKREHGEAEERVVKIDDLFMANPVTDVDIQNSILEIQILEEPIFRNRDDKYYNTSAKHFVYEPNIYIPDDDPEKIILKHKFYLDKIEEIVKSKDIKFPINVVYKFVNPKYSDKLIIKSLN